MSDVERTVETHYSSGSVVKRIQEAVEAAGLDWDNLEWFELAPVDHFHIRGIQATRAMGLLAGFAKGMSVLDVGCGIGGPARCIAREFRCNVHGIDLTPDFVAAAKVLTEKLGLSDRATFECCSVLELPQASASFDAVLMQHLNMNIGDKPGLFSEIARVLRPGGILAMHEILADEADQPYFPVPWASAAEGSFLCQKEELRAHAITSGFEIVDFKDVTTESTAWFEAIFAKAASGNASKLNLSVLMGDRFPEMAHNAHRSLVENRIMVVMAVCKKM